MEKVIFLDVDGTLCDNEGKVPASARSAIRIAQHNGHRLFLCTGRPKAEITEELLDLKLDGMIGGGGTYCEVGDEIILNQVFVEEELLELVHYFKRRKIEYYMGSSQGMFCSSRLKETIIGMVQNQSGSDTEKMTMETVQWFLDLMNEDESQLDFSAVNRICFINQKIPYEEVYERFGQQFHIIHSTAAMFGENSGEIGLKGVRKQTAIEFLLNHLDVKKEDTIAFGDGHNDIDMFEAVGIGVAMGNACEELLSIADFVTKKNTEDGLAFAFKRLGIL